MPMKKYTVLCGTFHLRRLFFFKNFDVILSWLNGLFIDTWDVSSSSARNYQGTRSQQEKGPPNSNMTHCAEVVRTAGPPHNWGRTLWGAPGTSGWARRSWCEARRSHGWDPRRTSCPHGQSKTAGRTWWIGESETNHAFTTELRFCQIAATLGSRQKSITK